MQGFQVPLSEPTGLLRRIGSSLQVLQVPLQTKKLVAWGRSYALSAYFLHSSFGNILHKSGQKIWRDQGLSREGFMLAGCRAAGVTDVDTAAQYLELPNHLPGDLMFIACRCQGMT